MEVKNVLWFRHGLRLHDNPALLEAIRGDIRCRVIFYPVFIFDGESAGTQLIGYNRMKFLIECLADLDRQFKELGGPGLFVFRGNPTTIFMRMKTRLGINKICYEQDCEPIWHKRDKSVVDMCCELDIETVEKISNTLWDPNDIIDANGGHAPLTYQIMLHTVDVLGLPPRPVIGAADFSGVEFGKISKSYGPEMGLLEKLPRPEDFSLHPERERTRKSSLTWKGGEKRALEQLELRLKIEEDAFVNGSYLPNQANIDLFSPPSSMSAALRFGCLSVRHFFYSVHDKFHKVQEKKIYKFPGGHHITGQLIWREYFYAMSVRNPNYARMKDNPLCLNIPWYEPKEGQVEKWKNGTTGIPIIDATQRQLRAEGWVHHTLRNLSASFLTRTGLWLNWEIGFEHFQKYLLDADWSVNAGNWMWVSSSAFEKMLDSSKCSIIAMAMRLDPKGDYIKRYIPELRYFPRAFIHQPWKAPLRVQEACGCIIGQPGHYPSPMIDLKRAAQINCEQMKIIRESIFEGQPHIRPSNEDEIRTFFWIADEIPIECM